ncbi:MAG TPA: methionyl-tRNA formyltransferase [Polyangiaceae bacterium]
MRAIFFGTPEIAVPALRALGEVAEIVAVVSQPDRPAGRGLQLAVPAVKQAALELGLAVHQPKAVKTGALATWVREHTVDVALVMAYGRILPLDVLNAPRVGSLNLHASLLPKYRGAAPIQRAIIEGERETGISLMHMDEGMDTGAVYHRSFLSIAPDEDAGHLAERLSSLAAEVTRHQLARAVRGELAAVPQDPALASYAPPIDNALRTVDWSQSATRIACLVRGLAPRPSAITTARGKHLKLLEVEAIDATHLAPGEVAVQSGGMCVGTGQGAIVVLRAQVEGKRAASGRDLVNGRVVVPGDRLGAV